MWTLTCIADPVPPRSDMFGGSTPRSQKTSSIVHASVPISNLFPSSNSSENAASKEWMAFQDGGRGGRVALADFTARRLNNHKALSSVSIHGKDVAVLVEPLDRTIRNARQRRRRSSNAMNMYPPYVLERTDVWCSEKDLHLTIRVVIENNYSPVMSDSMDYDTYDEKKMEGSDGMNVHLSDSERMIQNVSKQALESMFQSHDPSFVQELMAHVACIQLQQRLREQLSGLKAVAFIADGSILPRKSGVSDAPMASPPAIPFKAPAGSPMARTISVDMGLLKGYLPTLPSSIGGDESSSTVTLSGLVVPAGITLIAGGGYHGKSTLLQAIANGVYDKIPGDGREYCVAVRDAVSVRAEDGRYVNNCNVSAFISNLPTPPGVSKTLDTQHFSSRDSSGSTSQAANVSEAVEMGASALLVDEDISAANFMARDGRMRALVMDESITPLLYRVNGLYNAHGISSVVVVGGVGDWLDVPNQVILLDKYVASDATKKAQSISYQFSHGHVQYAGRGVVHRLPWDKFGTPIPRRPSDSFSKGYTGSTVSLLDGGQSIALNVNEDDDDQVMVQSNDVDEDEGCIDASKLEQLLGRNQLYGCGLCVAWLLQAAQRNPTFGIQQLLQLLQDELDKRGMAELYKDIRIQSDNNNHSSFFQPSQQWKELIESVGFAHRPRIFEVGQALTRMRGIQLEELPVEDDGSEEAARKEEERKKQELAALWAARRKK